ncbi:MAG: ATP-binding protein [Brevinematia bacterium]
MKRFVLFFLILVVSLILSVFISDWIYSISFGAVGRLLSFFISFSIVLSFVMSVVLLLKSFRDFFQKKLGSRIRLRLIGLFLIVSIISNGILSSIFISTIDALKASIESKEGEKISDISKNLMKDLSSNYKNIFNRLKLSLDGKQQDGVNVVNIDYDKLPSDVVLSNIVENIKVYPAIEGQSVIIVDDREFVFSFRRDSKLKLAYTEVDSVVYRFKKGISKILQISSNSEFLFYEVFGKYFGIIIFLLNVPSIFASILAGYFFSEYVSRGISNLSKGMIEVAKGNFNYTVTEKGALDEIRVLIREFNRMILKLLEAQYRISKMEKIELWKDIARKVAHEIKNPLTPMKLLIQRLLLNLDAPDLKEKLTSSLPVVLEEIDRIDNLITQLSNFAKIPQPSPTEFKFSDLMDDIVNLFSDQNVQIEIVLSGEDTIFADKDQIKQCLINLIKNGIEASEGKSNKITVKFNREKDSIVISVRDYGFGIPDDMKDKILKPYITTKKTGSGLGLSIVESIVLSHGGKLYFESKLGEGSEFFIELPCN